MLGLIWYISLCVWFYLSFLFLFYNNLFGCVLMCFIFCCYVIFSMLFVLFYLSALYMFMIRDFGSSNNVFN